MTRGVDFFFARSIPEPNTGCWLWLNAVSWNGYGIVRANGRNINAHRHCYEVTRGVTLTRNIDVCHSCDVRCCVNPDHLFIGTRTDNMRDCANKGRIVIPNMRGEALTQSKLTEAEVREIRDSGLSQRALGRLYGVDRGTIAQIVQGKTWRHV